MNKSYKRFIGFQAAGLVDDIDKRYIVSVFRASVRQFHFQAAFIGKVFPASFKRVHHFAVFRQEFLENVCQDLSAIKIILRGFLERAYDIAPLFPVKEIEVDDRDALGITCNDFVG